MKPNNRLNKALHEALRDHPEPLHEAQWERLRADLDRDKKRKFPWFFLLTGVVLLASISTYLLMDKDTAPENHVSVLSNTSQSGTQNATQSTVAPPENPNNSSNTPASGVQNSNSPKSTAPVSGNGHTGNGSGVISNNNQPNQPKSTPSQSNSNPNTSNNAGSSGLNPVNASGNPDKMADQPAKNPITNNPTQINSTLNNASNGKENPNDQTVSANDSRKTSDSTHSDLPKTLSGQSLEPGALDSHKPVDDTQPGDSSQVNASSPVAGKSDDKNDGKKDKNKNKDNDDKTTRIVLGFTGGISLASTKIVDLTNQQYFHKDTKKVFQENNKNQTSTFFNFSFEYKFKHLGLRFNSGMQYRSISNKINYTYRLNEVPFRNSNNAIDTYFHVPDSSALTFDVASRQSLRFITVPIQLSYGFKLNSKYELILNAGINISAMVGAKGNTLDLASYEVTKVSSMIKQKFTFGYTGGLQISRQLYNNWWLGLEANLGTINLAYKMGYGDLKSRILNKSLSLQLRYKL